MKKIILFSLVLFSIILQKNNLYAEDNIIYPLKKPILKPDVKEKKISKNIIKPLKKPVVKKIKEKKVTKLGIIVPKIKPKIVKKTIKKLGPEFIQLTGEDGLAFEFNKRGGVGIISVTANIAPKLCSEMQKFSKSDSDNEIKEAERIDSLLLYMLVYVNLLK